MPASTAPASTAASAPRTSSAGITRSEIAGQIFCDSSQNLAYLPAGTDSGFAARPGGSPAPPGRRRKRSRARFPAARRPPVGSTAAMTPRGEIDQPGPGHPVHPSLVRREEDVRLVRCDDLTRQVVRGAQVEYQARACGPLDGRSHLLEHVPQARRGVDLDLGRLHGDRRSRSRQHACEDDESQQGGAPHCFHPTRSLGTHNSRAGIERQRG